jgi:DNA-directed RNA polymerase specialized sigma24 family protein
MNKVLLNKTFQSSKQSLSNDNKELLSLYLEQHLSQDAIAEKFSTTAAQVKKRIAKALLELRKVSNDPNYLKAMEILSKE